jgi:hypothetical protein
MKPTITALQRMLSGAKIQRDLPGKRIHGALGGLIGRPPGDRADAGRRRDVHDRAPACAAHVGDGVFRHPHRAGRGHPERLIPDLRVQEVDMAVFAPGAGDVGGGGVVHQDVEPAIESRRLLHGGLTLFLDAHVAGDEGDRMPFPAQLVFYGRALFLAPAR